MEMNVFPERGRWFVPALGVAQICSWGTLYYSFPQVAEAVGADYGWSRAQIYGAATVGLILSGLAAYPVGAAIDRGYGRVVMSGASLLAGILMVAWSQVTDLFWFYVVFAGIGCLHAGTLYEPCFAVVSRRVGAGNARRAITSLTLWGGFASTVFVPLIQFLFDRVGWRDTLIVLGAVNIFLCAGLYGGAIRPARDLPGSAPTDAGAGTVKAAPDRHVARALRDPVFWALAVFFVIQAGIVSAFMFHLYPLLVEKGLEVGQVVAIVAIVGPAQVVGRIAVALVGPRASIAAVGSVTVAVMLAAFAGFALLPAGFVALALLAGLYGAANGVATIVRGLAVPAMLTTRAYGAVNGVLAAPSMILKAVAPVAAAWLWQTTGSYDAVALGLAAAALVMCLGFWGAAALRMRRPLPPI